MKLIQIQQILIQLDKRFEFNISLLIIENPTNYKIMFTLEKIKEAHSKVKSGVDFPNYIKDLKQLGVIAYETFVMDSHADYYGNQHFKISSAPKYDALIIADNTNSDQFKSDLKTHQQGKTDYLTFCKDCAKSGIENWKVDTLKMTCTYFDKSQDVILVEIIPA